MMRRWADEFDRLREHGRVVKMMPEEKRVQCWVAPLSRTSISSTCWCQGGPEVTAPLLVADVRSLS